jgi:hypothetical protein
MTEINPERAAVIQQITVLAQALYDALESQNTGQILVAQQSLSTAVEILWPRVESDATVTGREKGFLRLLAGAAIKELPERIKDPANYAKIKQDLRLLKTSVELL